MTNTINVSLTIPANSDANKFINNRIDVTFQNLDSLKTSSSSVENRFSSNMYEFSFKNHTDSISPGKFPPEKPCCEDKVSFPTPTKKTDFQNTFDIKIKNTFSQQDINVNVIKKNNISTAPNRTSHAQLNTLKSDRQCSSIKYCDTPNNVCKVDLISDDPYSIPKSNYCTDDYQCGSSNVEGSSLRAHQNASMLQKHNTTNVRTKNDCDTPECETDSLLSSKCTCAKCDGTHGSIADKSTSTHSIKCISTDDFFNNFESSAETILVQKLDNVNFKNLDKNLRKLLINILICTCKQIQQKYRQYFHLEIPMNSAELLRRCSSCDCENDARATNIITYACQYFKQKSHELESFVGNNFDLNCPRLNLSAGGNISKFSKEFQSLSACNENLKFICQQPYVFHNRNFVDYRCHQYGRTNIGNISKRYNHSRSPCYCIENDSTRCYCSSYFENDGCSSLCHQYIPQSMNCRGCTGRNATTSGCGTMIVSQQNGNIFSGSITPDGFFKPIFYLCTGYDGTSTIISRVPKYCPTCQQFLTVENHLRLSCCCHHQHQRRTCFLGGVDDGYAKKCERKIQTNLSTKQVRFPTQKTSELSLLPTKDTNSKKVVVLKEHMNTFGHLKTSDNCDSSSCDDVSCRTSSTSQIIVETTVDKSCLSLKLQSKQDLNVSVKSETGIKSSSSSNCLPCQKLDIDIPPMEEPCVISCVEPKSCITCSKQEECIPCKKDVKIVEECSNTCTCNISEKSENFVESEECTPCVCPPFEVLKTLEISVHEKTNSSTQTPCNKKDCATCTTQCVDAYSSMPKKKCQVKISEPCPTKQPSVSMDCSSPPPTKCTNNEFSPCENDCTIYTNFFRHFMGPNLFETIYDLIDVLIKIRATGDAQTVCQVSK